MSDFGPMCGGAGARIKNCRDGPARLPQLKTDGSPFEKKEALFKVVFCLLRQSMFALLTCILVTCH